MPKYPVYLLPIGEYRWDVSWHSDSEVYVHLYSPYYLCKCVRSKFCIQRLKEVLFPSVQLSLF